MRRTTGSVRSLLAQDGYLLQSNYQHNKQKLSVVCPVGHSIKVILSNYLRGTRCPECAGVKRFSLKEVQNLCSKQGYTLLSPQYLNNRQKLSFLCPKGHTYLATFHNFRAGHRCIICHGSNIPNPPDKVRDFIRSKGYSWIGGAYENNRSKLSLRCKVGHEFSMGFGTLMTHGCPRCNGGTRKNWDDLKHQALTAGFVLISKEDDYQNHRSSLMWRCTKDHEFRARASTLFRVRKQFRCPVCRDQSWDTPSVKQMVESRGFQLLSDYIPNQPLNLLCPRDHETRVRLSDFRSEGGCLICARENRRVSRELLLKELEFRGLTWLEGEYESNRTVLSLQCREGHIFRNSWFFIQGGSQCPQCGQDKPKEEIKEYIRGLGFTPTLHQTLPSGCEIDFLVPEKKLAIEFCGLFWHSTAMLKSKQEKISVYHQKKLLDCERAGYKLLIIFEDEWNTKKELVKNKIRHNLGLPLTRFYARVGKVREITKEEGKDFFNNHHLQGATGYKIGYGLYIGEMLMVAITVGSPNRSHTAEKGAWEIKRLAVRQGFHIPGGVSRVFKEVLTRARIEKVPEIISFCDRRWSDGGVYSKLGMVLKSCGRPAPQRTDLVRRWRNQSFMGKARNEKHYTIYDCGHQKWVIRLGDQAG